MDFRDIRGVDDGRGEYSTPVNWCLALIVAASGLCRLNEDKIAERGARMARRDDREYREYLREEQRSQAGCIAGRMPAHL